MLPLVRSLVKLTGATTLGAMLCVSLAVFAQDPGKAPKPPKPPKPGKLNFNLISQTHLANSGVIGDANGRVNLHVNGHSKGNNEDLHVQVRRLDANATYELTAQTGPDTNSTQVQLAEFTTDVNGNAELDFRSKNPGKGPGEGNHKQPIPGELEPITSITGLSVSDTNGQPLLTADLTAPDKFEYVLKQDLPATGRGKATLDLKANNHKSTLRVNAWGFSPGADYSLALNGNVVTTATADAKGKLKLGWQLDNPADVLAIDTVSLVDSGGAEVATAALP